MTPPARTADDKQSIFNMGVLTAKLEGLYAIAEETKKMLNDHIEHQVKFETTYASDQANVIAKAESAFNRAEELAKKVECHGDKLTELERRMSPLESLYKWSARVFIIMFPAGVMSLIAFIWALINHQIYIYHP